MDALVWSAGATLDASFGASFGTTSFGASFGASFAVYRSLSDLALLVALSSTRVAVAFLLLPVFSPETVPALIRNAIFLSMGLLTLALQPAFALDALTGWQWVVLFAKEAVIGLALGFGLAAFLWAFEAAGQIVDTKVSVSNTQLTDPLSGQQVSISGALLGRLAGFLFMFGGGMLLFVGTIIESFAAWPIGRMNVMPRIGAVPLFEHQFADLMTLAFLASGELGAHDLAWTEGLVDWEPVQNLLARWPDDGTDPCCIGCARVLLDWAASYLRCSTSSN